MAKVLHIHLGPHKTGSTAIQTFLASKTDALYDSCGLTYIHDDCIEDAARAMIDADIDAVQIALKTLADLVGDAPGDCLISNEDLSGNLPGRSHKSRIYPGLWQNIKKLRTNLPNITTKFYFFLRDPDSWMQSAYAQHVSHRSRFSDFDAFYNHFRTDDLWDGVLQRPRNRLMQDLVEITYQTGEDFSSIDALLGAIAGPDVDLSALGERPRRNTSPPSDHLRILEAISDSAASSHAKKSARQRLTKNATETKFAAASPETLPQWPPGVRQPAWLAPRLAPLWSRTARRVTPQAQPLLLPDLDDDLTEYRTRIVEAPDAFPEGGRGQMENQINILCYRFRGSSELCVLLGLAISYLRRYTEHTEHAAQFFQKLWVEEHDILLGLLPTRWLISTFQTFMDHGVNEDQRLIGSAAYFMTNTLKLYEAERALEGQAPNAIYPNTQPQTKSGFKGLDRIALGGSDLMVNMNALLLELAARDAVAGRVVQEFYLRMRSSATVFSRMDNSRKHHDVNIPQFLNCWSFFEEPDE